MHNSPFFQRDALSLLNLVNSEELEQVVSNRDVGFLQKDKNEHIHIFMKGPTTAYVKKNNIKSLHVQVIICDAAPWCSSNIHLYHTVISVMQMTKLAPYYSISNPKTASRVFSQGIERWYLLLTACNNKELESPMNYRVWCACVWGVVGWRGGLLL